MPQQSRFSPYRRPLYLTVGGGLGVLVSVAALIALWSSAGVNFSLEGFTLGVDFGAVDALTTTLLLSVGFVSTIVMTVGIVKLTIAVPEQRHLMRREEVAEEFIQTLRRMICKGDFRVGTMTTKVEDGDIFIESIRSDGIAQGKINRQLLSSIPKDRISDLVYDTLQAFENTMRRLPFCPICEDRARMKNDYLCEECRYGFISEEV